MSTINTSSYASSTYASSTTSKVNSFQKEAEDLMKDQVAIGKDGTYDSYVSSQSNEFENPGSVSMSGIYTSVMGNTKGVVYDDNGDVESVDVTQLQYNRMADQQSMISVMMGQKPSATSIADLVSSVLGTSSSNTAIATALTTDEGAYSVDSVSEGILDMAGEIAGDDLEVLAELKNAFVEAYEKEGDSDSALSKDTYTKVLSGFNTLENAITSRLEAAAEAETETEAE